MSCLTCAIACVRLYSSIKYKNLMSACKYICAYDRVPPNSRFYSMVLSICLCSTLALMQVSIELKIYQINRQNSCKTKVT